MSNTNVNWHSGIKGSGSRVIFNPSSSHTGFPAIHAQGVGGNPYLKIRFPFF